MELNERTGVGDSWTAVASEIIYSSVSRNRKEFSAIKTEIANLFFDGRLL